MEIAPLLTVTGWPFILGDPLSCLPSSVATADNSWLLAVPAGTLMVPR